MSRSHRSLLLVLLVLSAVLAAAAVSACGSDTAAGPSSPAADPVVLQVNGHPVHQSAIDAVRAEFRLGGASDAVARAEKEAVRRELERQEAERLGVAADPAEVAARRADMVSQLGGEDALTAALGRVPMTDDQLRSGLRDGVLREALQDVKFKDLAATPVQARAYYDAHRASFRQTASAHLWSIQVAAERIAQNAIQRLREGRPFAEVARQFSSDPESKAKGGDMGVVALSSLPATFRKAVESTPSGKVTAPVQGPGGWYVLKATGLTPARTPAFSEVEQQILKELTRRKRFAALDTWLDTARSQAQVTRP